MLKSMIFSLILTIFYLLISTARAHAQTPTCPPLYGGGLTCEKHPDLSIDKQVQDPQTKKYIDSLTTVSNFLPDNQTLIFRITVKNTSNKSLSNILFEDTLPAILTYKSGDGSFDAKTKKVSDRIEKLDKGQSRTYIINTNINRDLLNNSTACSINHTQITQNNKKGSDYIKLCINASQNSSGLNQEVLSDNKTKGGQQTLNNQPLTKGGLPVFNPGTPTKTPDTGPELLGVIGLPLIASVGYYLHKKS